VDQHTDELPVTTTAGRRAGPERLIAETVSAVCGPRGRAMRFLSTRLCEAVGRDRGTLEGAAGQVSISGALVETLEPHTSKFATANAFFSMNSRRGST
jgi:hypothetical protein